MKLKSHWLGKIVQLGYNILCIGPPGLGKSMFAKQIPSILPQLTMREAIETTKVHSICGLLNGQYRFVTNRPFRSPHHTISGAGLPLDKSQPLLEQIKAGIQAVRVGAHCPSGFTASSICAEISFGSGTAP